MNEQTNIADDKRVDKQMMNECGTEKAAYRIAEQLVRFDAAQCESVNVCGGVTVFGIPKVP